MVDEQGLITTERSGLNSIIAPFASSRLDWKDLPLAEAVKQVQPTCLIGVTGQAKLFSKEVLQNLANAPGNTQKILPLVLALSSPNSRAECTAEEAFNFTNGRVIFASGAPFKNFKHNEQTIKSNHSSNCYIYPGLAFGAHLAKASHISDMMILKAAQALPELLTPAEIETRAIYPDLNSIRNVSVHVAARVIEQANKENLVNCPIIKQKLLESFDTLKDYIRIMQWKPHY